MTLWTHYAAGLLLVAGLAVLGWLLSLVKHDVGIVDSLWSLMLLVLGAWFAWDAPVLGLRAVLTLVLLLVWAVRLSLYITMRNWGEPEDRRYRAIRARNQPHFEFKSLYLVFLLQAFLAWVVSLPLLGALHSVRAFGPLDSLGLGLIAAGLVFEAGGDWQLAQFRKDPKNRERVMDRGLWRYTRHPNYFGEFCVWWGFYAIALGAGAWWSLLGPLLMTVLLMRVSGVTLLEKTIAHRRPAYQAYARRTNAFFPGLPRD